MSQSGSFLLTDLCQQAMMQACFEAGETGTAVFEFFVRKRPGTRGILVAADPARDRSACRRRNMSRPV